MVNGNNANGPVAMVNNWMNEDMEQKLKVAKRILSINLPPLCMILMMIPFNALLGYKYFSGQSCSGNQTFNLLLQTASVIVPTSGLVYFYIAGKKIEKLHSA